MFYYAEFGQADYTEETESGMEFPYELDMSELNGLYTSDELIQDAAKRFIEEYGNPTTSIDWEDDWDPIEGKLHISAMYEAEVDGKTLQVSASIEITPYVMKKADSYRG